MPLKEANRPEDELWKLLTTLYGLLESSFLWCATYIVHLCSIVGTKASAIDLSLFVTGKVADLQTNSFGVVSVSVLVGDFFLTGTKSFLDAEDKASLRLLFEPINEISKGSMGLTLGLCR